MQQRNFWIFVFLSSLLVAGWIGMQFLLPPLPEPKTKDKTAGQKDDKKKSLEQEKLPAEVRQRLPWDLTAAALPSLADPAGVSRLTSALLTVENKVAPILAAKKREEEAKQRAQKALPAKKTETVELGSEDSFLRVVLTTQGAGVRQLTLPNFQSADWYGKPSYMDEDGKRVPAPLQLIPEDPFQPSFLMYHYPPKQDMTPEKAIDRDIEAVVEDTPSADLGLAVWTLEKRPDTSAEVQTAVFSTPGPAPHYDHLVIRKIYTLDRKWYHVRLQVEIENTQPEKKALPFRYQLAGAHGVHMEGIWYTYTHRNAMIGTVDTSNYLWRTLEASRQISYRDGGNRVPEARRGASYLQYGAVTTQYFASAIVADNEQPSSQEGGVGMANIFAYARPTEESAEKYVRLDKIDLDQAEITVTILSKDKKKGNEPDHRLQLVPRAIEDLKDKEFKEGDQIIANIYTALDGKEVATGFRLGNEPKEWLDDITVRMVSEPIQMHDKERVVQNLMLYHGPVKVSQLRYLRGDVAVDDELIDRYADTLHLNTLTDYQMEGWFGQISKTLMWTDLLIFLTGFMHWLLNALYYVVPNEGLVVILLTVIVRGMLFPISRKQAQMTMKMQALAPEMKKLKEKYKNDMQAQQQAMMELYRKHGVNPMGSCLPLFLQLPIFLSLYYCLQESILFRLAGFLWIPNLAAPDMLFPWGQSIPWITDPDNMGGMVYLGPFFNLLPVLAVINMMIQQQLMMPPPTDEQQEIQQKTMKYMLIFFGLIFYKVAAGLCIYFIASALWGLAERKMLPKKKPENTTAPAGATDGTAPPRGTPGPGGKKRGKPGRNIPPKPEDQTQLQKVRSWWEEVLKQAKKK